MSCQSWTNPLSTNVPVQGDLLRSHDREKIRNTSRGYWSYESKRKSPCGVGLGNTLQLPKEVIVGAIAILPGSKWSCLLLRLVLQDALSEVTKFYTPLKLRVSVDDITAKK